MVGVNPTDDELCWRKATFSAGDGACVQIASAQEYVAIRDSKNPESGMLRCSPEQFRSMLDAVKNGGFMI
jgi:Domain of unknown function (DUF397)